MRAAVGVVVAARREVVKRPIDLTGRHLQPPRTAINAYSKPVRSASFRHSGSLAINPSKSAMTA